MKPLVTIDQVKDHLYIGADEHDHDQHLVFLARVGSEIIIDYLKMDTIPAAWYDSDGEPSDDVPALIQACILETVGEMFKNREANTGDVVSEKVARMLIRKRDPAAA